MLPTIRSRLGKEPLTDGVILFRQYNPVKDLIVSRFSPEDWQKIEVYKTTESQWQQYTELMHDVCCCYIISQVSTSKEIGFIYLIQINFKPLTVEFHGGGWCDDLISKQLYFRSVIFLIDTLLSQGVAVRSSSFLSNKCSLKLLKAVGFRATRYTSDMVYLTINRKWIEQGRFFKKFIQHK